MEDLCNAAKFMIIAFIKLSKTTKRIIGIEKEENVESNVEIGEGEKNIIHKTKPVEPSTSDVEIDKGVVQYPVKPVGIGCPKSNMGNIRIDEICHLSAEENVKVSQIEKDPSPECAGMINETRNHLTKTKQEDGHDRSYDAINIACKLYMKENQKRNKKRSRRIDDKSDFDQPIKKIIKIAESCDRIPDIHARVTHISTERDPPNSDTNHLGERASEDEVKTEVKQNKIANIERNNKYVNDKIDRLNKIGSNMNNYLFCRFLDQCLNIEQIEPDTCQDQNVLTETQLHDMYNDLDGYSTE